MNNLKGIPVIFNIKIVKRCRAIDNQIVVEVFLPYSALNLRSQVRFFKITEKGLW